MKKSRKKMLRASLLMLIVATLSLSSATFAWFSSGKEAKVADMQITAETASGMQISLDGENWLSEVDVSKISSTTGGQTGYNVSGEIGPVSSVGDVSQTEGSKGQMQLFTGTIDGDKLKTDTATASGNYYVFNLYFKNDSNEKQNLMFDLTSAIADATAEQIAAEAAKTPKNDIENTGIANAARVAFVYHGGTDKGAEAVKYKEGDTIPEGKNVGDEKTPAKSAAEVARELVTSDSSCVFIFEPNDLTHGAYAVANRNVTSASEAKLAYNGIKVKDTTGLALGSGTTAGIATATTDKVVAVSTVTKTSTVTSQKVAEMPANAICKVTVYIWLEGQDVDCNNAESGGTLYAALKFSAEAVATE